ncbi:MAG: hypothetical protein K2Y37_17265 [Pirellulales bacterium]|nr:hypothetical protein [Pirellulales bacterium]
MSKKLLCFFAHPSEQVRWLKERLNDPEIWCVGKMGVPTSEYFTVDSDSVDSLQFTGIHGTELMLFLGHANLQTDVVWRSTARHILEIDFVRSQAIQCLPSLIVDASILTEGQLAIMDASYYEEVGIDPRPLQRWFRDVVRSFRALRAPRMALGKVDHAAIKRWPSVVVSPGAVDWRKSGRKLKQFPKGAAEFDIV